MSITTELRRAITNLEGACDSSRDRAREKVGAELDRVDDQFDLLRADDGDAWSQCNQWRSMYEDLLKKPDIGKR